jgi:hypothetical protein
LFFSTCTIISKVPAGADVVVSTGADVVVFTGATETAGVPAGADVVVSTGATETAGTVVSRLHIRKIPQ